MIGVTAYPPPLLRIPMDLPKLKIVIEAVMLGSDEAGGYSSCKWSQMELLLLQGLLLRRQQN